MNGAAPKVSVLMVAYKHAPFIAEAIESVLMQRTDFDFELVIGDDFSPDGTREVAQRYAAAHPGRIRLHLPEKNLGLTRNVAATLRLCRAPLVAWLEGDDFWTSPGKLQRQADYLDAHPDCAWCFTRAAVVDQAGRPIRAESVVRVVKPRYELEDYLRRDFQPRACTVMFRYPRPIDFPDWFFEMPTADMPLHVLNTAQGGIGFIDEEMAAYRIHPGGVWSQGFSPAEWGGETVAEQRHLIHCIGATMKVYCALENHFAGRYRDIIRPRIARFAARLATLHRSLRQWPEMRRALGVALKHSPLRWPFSPAWLAESLLVSYLPFLSRSAPARG